MELGNLAERLQRAREAPKKGITNERQYVLKQFLETLNLDRKPPYKPLTPARLGMMLRFLDTSHLKSFLGECRDAKNFSKYFWWRFKR